MLVVLGIDQSRKIMQIKKLNEVFCYNVSFRRWIKWQLWKWEKRCVRDFGGEDGKVGIKEKEIKRNEDYEVDFFELEVRKI